MNNNIEYQLNLCVENGCMAPMIANMLLACFNVAKLRWGDGDTIEYGTVIRDMLEENA